MCCAKFLLNKMRVYSFILLNNILSLHFIASLLRIKMRHWPALALKFPLIRVVANGTAAEAFFLIDERGVEHFTLLFV